MYSQEVADRICSGLAEGKSLRAVCREDGMPSHSTVLGWLEDEDKKAFAEQYARARARQYALLADEIMAIADDGTNDSWVDDDGQVRTNQDVIARSRLRVDTRKWMLSKMLPKVYGDKTVIEGGESPVKHDHTLSLSDAAQRTIDLIAGSAKTGGDAEAVSG